MCTSIHAPIEAACEIVRKEKFSVDDITKIIVRTTTGAQGNTVGFVPETISSAQLSLAFGVATAILTGNVRPANVTMEALKDPKIVRLMDLIKPYKDPELDAIWKGIGRASSSWRQGPDQFSHTRCFTDDGQGDRGQGKRRGNACRGRAADGEDHRVLPQRGETRPRGFSV
jgi:hypothetical protein